MKVEVYSDGSATTADKPGGWAYVIVIDGKKHTEASGHLPKATNNVAEITAAIKGLEAIWTDKTLLAQITEIVLISDSMLVLNYANGTYQCRKPHLVPLFIALRKVYRLLNAKTQWVKGHSGNEHNEKCDELAKSARNGPSEPIVPAAQD